MGPWVSEVVRAVVLFVLLGVVLWMMNRLHEKKAARADLLEQKYAVMTKTLLCAIPDAELLEAVIANLHAKQDPKQPDPYCTLPLLSHERALVYSVWLVSKELETGTMGALLGGPSAPFCEYAVEGLTQMGAVTAAKALSDAMEATTPEAVANCGVDYQNAVAWELPLSRCVTYIRENAAAFLDEEGEEYGEN